MSFQPYFFHNLTNKSMSEFIQNPRGKEDDSARPWIYPISQTWISCKILTQLHRQESLRLSLWQAIGDTVCGEHRTGCLLQSASSLPAPPHDFKGNIPISSFSYPYGTFVQYFLFTCLYNLHPLAVAASSHLVKDHSFISFRPISYQLHWVPHSSNILPFGKQLFISFIKSWRQWINLYSILELSACPTDFKLWTCSLSGLSMQASCSLPRLDSVTLV